MPRIVQIGIWDQVSLQVSKKEQIRIKDIQLTTGATKLKDLGELKVKAELSGNSAQNNIRIILADQNGKSILKDDSFRDHLQDRTKPQDGKTSGKALTGMYMAYGTCLSQATIRP
jgi:hypothetical protein